MVCTTLHRKESVSCIIKPMRVLNKTQKCVYKKICSFCFDVPEIIEINVCCIQTGEQNIDNKYMWIIPYFVLLLHGSYEHEETQGKK
jgi:hypothetical protein